MSVVAGAASTYDSNVFRLPISVDTRATLGSDSAADTTYSAYAGLRVDAPVSLQRFQFDLTSTARRNERFKNLDFDATDYRVAWLWSVSPRLTGTLVADRAQALVPFTVFQGTQRNVRTTQNQRFDLVAQVTPRWHAIAGAGRSTSRSEQPFLAEADYRIDRSEVGVRFVAPSSDSVTLLRRHGDGEYLNRVPDPLLGVDNRYRDTETELRAIWSVTARSRLTGRLAHLERKHQSISARDFSGVSAEAGWQFAATQKLTVATALRRDVTPYFSATSNARTDHAASLEPRWLVTARTTAYARFQHISSRYSDLGGAAAGLERSDVTRAAELGVEWSPLRFATFSGSVARQGNRSNIAGVDYDATVFRLGASLTF